MHHGVTITHRPERQQTERYPPSMPYARRDIITWTIGDYYHIYNRGAHRFTIFPEDRCYLFALRRMKKIAQRLDIAVVAYCLLPNHYHLCVRQDGNVSAGQLPRRVFNSYSKWFNRRYGHSGTLFERRFQAKAVDDDAYLRTLCLYIHANPVRHGIALRPDLWPYSNYVEWIGKRPGTMYAQDVLADHFGSAEKYSIAMSKFLADLEW